MCELTSGPVADTIWIASKSNAAQAFLNLQDYPSAASYSTAVLKKESNNVKALYRRGCARNHLGIVEEALEDLNLALSLDPTNAAVKTEIIKVKKTIAESKKKAKETYGNMFSKVSMYDDKKGVVVPGLSPSCPKV
jgi:peptidylprolyl isomerase